MKINQTVRKVDLDELNQNYTLLYLLVLNQCGNILLFFHGFNLVY